MLIKVIYLFPISLCFYLLGCRFGNDHQKVHGTIVNLITSGQCISMEHIIIDILPFEDTPGELIWVLSDNNTLTLSLIAVHFTFFIKIDENCVHGNISQINNLVSIYKTVKYLKHSI